MRHPMLRTGAMSCVALAFAIPAAAAQEDADTLYVQGQDSRYEIVVSATRTPRNPINVPNATAVVTGQELRRRGTHTLAEALQDVVGLDTGAGSDNGARLPNVGMWGLKEFDALLFTLNGVPVGGPFNPSLSQIPIEDVDRIEIVKGPQSTLYGVSAFAGMVQVFTSGEEEGRGHAGMSGGSFGQGRGSLGWSSSFGGGRDLRLTGAFERSDGWQDRTASDVARGGAALGWGLGGGQMTLDLTGYRDRQDWGTPLPYEAGAPVQGFDPDRNYAVGGAEVRHQVLAATSRWTLPLRSGRRIENTLGFTRDDQRLVRSFPGELAGDTLESRGVELEPRESTLYEDLRVVADLNARGEHELVAGAALTWGETQGAGSEFEFDQALSAYPAIPSPGQITARDERDFEDRRTFLGLYAHDSWTPVARLTLGGGARLDATSEELETEADLPLISTRRSAPASSRRRRTWPRRRRRRSWSRSAPGRGRWGSNRGRSRSWRSRPRTSTCASRTS